MGPGDGGGKVPLGYDGVRGDTCKPARREGRPGHEVLTLYVLERFLYRLSVSAFRDQLVLKGGMLLPGKESRRQATSRRIEVVTAATAKAIV